MSSTRMAHADRGGFALPAAIMALVLLSALVAGALFVSTEELRAGRTDLADQRAMAMAEWALERAIAAWDPRRNTSLAIGASEFVGDTADDGVATTGDRVVVTATRVQRSGFLITAYGAYASDGRGIPTRHTIAASLSLVNARIPLRATLTAAGVVTVDGGVIEGIDTTTAAPGGLCNEGAASSVAGVAVPDTTLVCGAQCSGVPPAGVTGTPPVALATGLTNDPTGASGGVDAAAALADRASIDLPGGTLAPRPSVRASQCDRADPLNWGDPGRAGACADYYALVHVRGSLVLAAGSVGQGILLVDGSLVVEAGARFVGVVIVGDDIVVAGTGAEIVGIAFAQDGDRAGGSRIADGGTIRFASCAVSRAVLGTSRLTRTPERWWVELR